MNVFALTSRSEGMPLVILEAWAAGVPVVASSVGGLVEMLDGEKFGLMFPSGNDEAFAAALKRLLSDAGVAKRLSDTSRHHAEERFTTRRMNADYQRHYMQLLAAQPARAQELEEGLATNR
jgi:glycosyltransferase involved in cell wall biosynthesis